MASPQAHASSRDVLFGRLLPIFDEAAKNDKPVEMLGLSYAYSMDSFVQWQFGRAIGSNLIENEEERRMYLGGFFGPAPYTFWQYDFPSIPFYLKKLGINLIPKSVAIGFENIENWNLEKCDKAQQTISKADEVLEEDHPVLFAQAFKVMTKNNTEPVEKGSPQSYPQRMEIASDMFSHNSAAHETSGNALAYLYYELSQRPDLQVKLRQELLSLNPPFLYPPPSETVFQLPPAKDVDSLPLLDAMILETLRRHPSVPGRQPRRTPRTCSLGGYDDIPPNITVQCYAYSLHHTPEVFPDPLSWKPERWLDASPTELATMRKWFWAFGSGGRMCIGSNFANFCK
jgi:hypothetical protein